MATPGTDPETMLARTTVVSLALQALVLAGVLTGRDLIGMRKFGLELAEDLRAHGASGGQVGAERLEHEIMAWWNVIGTPDDHGT